MSNLGLCHSFGTGQDNKNSSLENLDTWQVEEDDYEEDVFWDSKHVYATDYLEAELTVNSVQYIETLKHLTIHVYCVQQSTEPIIVQHDNALPNISHCLLYTSRCV